MGGCQTAEEKRAEAAGKRLGHAAALTAAVPGIPEDCRKRERSGVRLGDPLDRALIQTDQALGRANARVKRCADWHDEFRSELSGDNKS
ncbi:MAG: hypothetical protein ABJL55_16220 [Roseibium sp.]